MTYWNTTHQKGKDLKKSQQKARTQDEIIKGIITSFKGKPFSPKDVYRQYPIMNNPFIMVSIRRSLDTLKKANFIRETGEMVSSLAGKKERQLIKA